MADSYSSLLGVLHMQTGSHDNDWGNQHDAFISGTIEKAVAGLNSISTTGGATNLAATAPPAGESSAIHMFQVVTGTLASTATITVPNVAKMWVFINNTTGGFGLLIKTASGTAINIPRGKPVVIVCDGSNGLYRADAQDVGTIVNFGGTTAPSDAFECDGSTKLIADYPDLYAKIGTTWGGNGTTNFILPDTKTAGRFLRSRTGFVAVGTYQTELVGRHDHTASASATTTTTGTTSSSGAHTHSVSGTAAASGAHQHYSFSSAAGVGATVGSSSFPSASKSWGSDSTYLIEGNANTPDVGLSTIAPDHTHSVSGTAASDGAHTHTLSLSSSTSVSVTVNASAGAENRPVCAVVMQCIKY